MLKDKVKITAADLAAIRPVLTKDFDIARVGPEYSIRHMTLVAATILQGAGMQNRRIIWPGDYGLLLWHLVVAPAMPPNAMLYAPASKSWPEWRHKISKDKLVERSRDYGFHESTDNSGRSLKFSPHPALAKLLQEDSVFPERCQAWFEAADAMLKR